LDAFDEFSKAPGSQDWIDVASKFYLTQNVVIDEDITKAITTFEKISNLYPQVERFYITVQSGYTMTQGYSWLFAMFACAMNFPASFMYSGSLDCYSCI
jgi:hypothetical protein